MTALRAAGITDPGQVRSQNQDTFFVADDLVLIADGMGGLRGRRGRRGDRRRGRRGALRRDGSATGLEDAVLDANRQIFERGVEPGLEGMGTTLVAAAVVRAGNLAGCCSRTWGTRAATCCEPARCVSSPRTTPSPPSSSGSDASRRTRAPSTPGRHVLTRALGVDRDVEPDLIELDPRDGDRLLLCSDGLSNELDDDQIVALLAVGDAVGRRARPRRRRERPRRPRQHHRGRGRRARRARPMPRPRRRVPPRSVAAPPAAPSPVKIPARRGEPRSTAVALGATMVGDRGGARRDLRRHQPGAPSPRNRPSRSGPSSREASADAGGARTDVSVARSTSG